MSDPTFTETWLPAPGDISFYTRTYSPPSSPPRGALIFIHGFIEHVARYEHAHKAWAARGFVVFTFDQRGFGRTALDAQKSKGSIYGRTSGPERMGDVEWAIKHVRAQYEGVPVFLMGHSMGGAIVLGFPTRTTAPPDKEIVSLLSGVIATSPLLHLARPPLSIVRWAGFKASTFLPTMNIPTPVEPKFISHDPVVCEENARDPLIKKFCSLRAMQDMLSRGEKLAAEEWKQWPKNLPLLLVHGTDDKVTDHTTTQKFFDNVVADDKKISLYPNGFHELQNEPDGVKEKLFDECITWAEAHIPSATTTAPEATSENQSKL